MRLSVIGMIWSGVSCGLAAWYAPVISSWGEQKLSAQPPGANRNTALQRRMRRLFAYAGLAYKSPHKFRHGTAVYGLQHARTMADYKAVSMNLMHNDIRITDGIYAVLNKEDVRARIASLSRQIKREWRVIWISTPL